MTETYYYCNGNTQGTVNVTLNVGSIYQRSQIWDGTGTLITTFGNDLTFSFNNYTFLASPNLSYLDVRYSYFLRLKKTRQFIGGGGEVIYDDQTTLVNDVSYKAVPGVDNPPVIFITTTNTFKIINNVIYRTYQTASSFILNSGSQVQCGTQPPTCHLSTYPNANWHTNETVMGANDGSLFIAVVGNTGGTVNYQLTSQYGVITQTTATFTGLAPGVYNAYVWQGNCSTSLSYNILQGQYKSSSFITTVPSLLSASENPMLVTLNTAVNSNNPCNSKMQFNVTGSVPTNSSIQFQLQYPIIYNVTFYAKSFPNQNNYFDSTILTNNLGIQVGTNTTTDIASSLADCLQKNTILSNLFFINNSGTTVTLIGKQQTRNLNLVGGTDVIISSGSNITFQTLQNGIDNYEGSMIQNYGLYAEVYVNPNLNFGQLADITTFNRVSEQFLPYNNSNIMQFKIDEILKNYVSTPKIDFSFSGASIISEMMASYYVNYGETYPIVVNTNTIKKKLKGTTTNNVGYVINSALPFVSANTMQGWLGSQGTNLNPYFDVTGSYALQFIKAINVIDSGTTGTTNIMYSLWTGNTMVHNWQTKPKISGVIKNNNYIFKISGITDGFPYTIQRGVIFNGYALQVDATYPITSIPTSFVNFLTNSPNPKLIQRNSTEFLYYIQQANYPFPTDLRGDIYFYDGTSIINHKFFDIFTGSTDFGGVIALNVGYDKLRLHDIEVSGSTLRKIKRIDFAVHQFQGGFQYSNTKSYIYAVDDALRRFGVAFLNKLGGYDIFDFTGIVENTLDRVAGTYNVPRKINFDGSSSLGFNVTSTYNTLETKTVTVNSGWLNTAHYLWLQELLASNSIYCYTEPDQPYLNITSYTYKKSSLEDLFDLEITFSYTLAETNINI